MKADVDGVKDTAAIRVAATLIPEGVSSLSFSSLEFRDTQQIAFVGSYSSVLFPSFNPLFCWIIPGKEESPENRNPPKNRPYSALPSSVEVPGFGRFNVQGRYWLRRCFK